ncbi:MAG: UDP-3-O-(3-hydroxymyristoyl)glucosamine N-acyltransferase [Rhodobacteraceae bacterium]|nr:MAG: UDP-3-O-(3-hydroxymyristoyl)glucosamine N-acyltransferase [Paracoccaceae bacterium]
MTQYSIKDIATALGAQAAGDLSLIVSGVNEPQSASASELALAMEEQYAPALKQGNAQAAILWDGADWQALGLKAAIFAPRSRYVLSGVSHVFEKRPDIAAGIHPSAIVDDTATIGAGASIGPFVVIGANVTIGKNARIASHSSIAENAVIGDDLLLYQGVRIGARVQIGNGFICQSNTVIGADGFSYVTPKPGAIEEARSSGTISQASETAGFARINSLGSVVIGDRVEMGASCAIDRGTVSNTVIGNGTKLDNLVHMAHNVRVGENCLLCGQVGIAGSVTIGDRCVLAGQVGVADHVTIGSDVIAAGKSGISSNVPPKRVIMGNPAVKMESNIESYKAIRRLPRLLAKVAKLEKIVSKSDENS